MQVGSRQKMDIVVSIKSVVILAYSNHNLVPGSCSRAKTASKRCSLVLSISRTNYILSIE